VKPRSLRSKLCVTLLLVALSLAAAPARADEIRVMVSGAFTSPYRALVAQWQKTTGHVVTTVYGASMGAAATAIPNRLARGEAADIVILAREALDALASAGTSAPVAARSGATCRQLPWWHRCD
jgi:molybdate transport system substrate-binding protein